MQPEAHVAAHFGSAEAQEHAGQLGMWVFIATEAMLFAGLFVAYALCRYLYPADFHAVAAREMDLASGTWNTFILLGSSVLVALADSWVKRGHNLKSAACLLGASGLGVLFMVLKLTEYAHHAAHGALPGKWYALAGLPQAGAALFITLYFLMTGLHAIHLAVAICALGWVAFRCATGAYSPSYHAPVELTGMYWHFVDVVWVFLYPLFYLVAV